MTSVNISQFEDSFVIHFGVESTRINAYTLATTLVNLADAAKAANASINPGYEIEVIVEALGSGSFKAKIKTLYKGASNLFSNDSLKQIVLNLIASYIFLHTLTPESSATIIVKTNEVIIKQGDKEYIVPRYVYDSISVVERNPVFTRGIGQAIRAVENDPEVKSLGITNKMDDSKPIIEIPRNNFAILTTPIEEEEKEARYLEEVTDVEITKAILERSNRKWEFVWNGVKMSSRITDQKFYDDFFAHRITIAPGDALRVRLRIYQKRLPDVGIFINGEYEITEVIQHIPRPKQTKLELK